MFSSPTATFRLAAALLTLVVALAAGAASASAGAKAPRTAWVADARGREGTSLAFVVTLSAASNSPVSVAFATVDGTATAGQDYAATSGLLTIPAGTTQGAVSVPLAADLVAEAAETLSLRLSSPSGVSLADAVATGTIVDWFASPGTKTSPIAASALAQGEGRPVDVTQPFVTRSVAPAGNALVVLQVAVSGTSVDLPRQVSGAGLRFDRIAEVRPRPDSPRTMGFFAAQGATPAPGQVRLSWAPDAPAVGSLSYTLTQYTGVAVGGNGRAAIAQIQYEAEHVNATTTEGRLDPLQDPVRNAVAAFFLVGTRGQDIVPELSYTEVTNLISQGSIFSLAVTFAKGGADLTPSVTWQREASNLWMALELVAAPG